MGMLEIVPDSVISVQDMNEKDHKETPNFNEYRMNGGDIFTNEDCYDGCSYWETFETNANFNSIKSESYESINEVICVGEKKNNINARTEDGGFVVIGAPELDDTINSDIDLRTMESEDEIEYLPQEILDDSLEIVDLVYDQYLIPRVFTGYIKEFIDENNQTGIIFSQDCGLVLFHTSHVWLNGTNTSDMEYNIEELSPGSDVSFYHYQIENESYRDVISPDGTLRQAAAVWRGRRPSHILKETENDYHRDAMEKHRNEFLVLLKERQFLPMALVRGRGQVEGYINSKIGIIRTEDGRNPRNCRVLFHTTDIYIFGKPLLAHESHEKYSAEYAVPVGLKLCFDARAIKRHSFIHNFEDISYQACAVFAGSWPAVPHPTVLPGGPGSFAPCYENHGDEGTYYYLQLSLRENLDKKWDDFGELVNNSHHPSRAGKYELQFKSSRVSILNHDDYKEWRRYFAPEYVLMRDRRRMENARLNQAGKRKKENFHYFKPSSERKWKVVKKECEEEFDNFKEEYSSISSRMSIKAETST